MPSTRRSTAPISAGWPSEIPSTSSVRCALSDRLGGHIVQGHVDGVGEVLSAAPDLRIGLPDRLGRYVVEKGSITVDGCSLTVVDVAESSFGIAVIPHTAEVTTLGHRRPGDRVNLEVDLVAKYVERLLTDQNRA